MSRDVRVLLTLRKSFDFEPSAPETAALPFSSRLAVLREWITDLKNHLSDADRLSDVAVTIPVDLWLAFIASDELKRVTRVNFLESRPQPEDETALAEILGVDAVVIETI